MEPNWDAINAIAQSAGALGVIISLLYLAFQVREDARSRRAATIHEQVEAHANALHSIATNGDLAGIFVRGLASLDGLDAVERTRFSGMLGYLFLNFEDSYFQHREGHLDDRVWNGIAVPLRELLAYDGVRAWWGTRSHHYGAQFQSYVTSLIAEGRKPNMYPEKMLKDAAIN